MILYSVHVENYRGIRGPVDLEFNPDCTNLLEGPNGAGKSTLVDAIQRCLTESHNTTGASADEMRPRGTALAPSITVVFGQAGSVYRVSKTFLDGAKAILDLRRADGGYDTIAQGKAADERVRKMLRSQPTRAKERVGERFGLFSILCGTQGDQCLPALSGDALADIRGMLGAQVAGDGAAFEQSIEKKYALLWTPGGKPKKGRLTEIGDALTQAKDNLQVRAGRMAQAAEKAASAERQRGESQRIFELLRSVRAEYDSVRPLADQVSELRARREPAAQRVKAADAVYSQGRAELDRIIELLEARKSYEERRPELERSEAEGRQARDNLAALASTARQAWNATAGPNPELRLSEQRIGRAGALLDLNAKADALQARILRAQAAHEIVAATERRITALSAPDTETWSRIQALARELHDNTVQVDALALRLEIDAEADLAPRVMLGDPGGPQTIAAGGKLTVRGDGVIRVHLPGVGAFALTGPGAADAAEWRGKQRQASESLRLMLAPFNVNAWSELEPRVREREKLALQLVELRAELAVALGGQLVDGMQQDFALLSAHRSEILAAEPAWVNEPPDIAALRAAAEDLKTCQEELQRSAFSSWQELEQRRIEADTLLSASALAHSNNNERLADAAAKLRPIEADGLTLADRRSQLAVRRKECESTADALRDLEAALSALPGDAPENAAQMAQRIAGLESELQSAREAYRQDEADVRAILVQGPYTSLASAEEQVRQLEEDEAAEKLRLDAIARLKASVHAAKAKALEGIAEPVEQRATALLERLSGRPLARVRLGDGMAVRSVRPEGAGNEAAVAQMSAGEQEQIYFATRLALAEVLAGNERQVLVLDDPLVNTDSDRLASALQIIVEKSERFQFVILTCHPGRYIELPGAVSTRVDHMTAVAAETAGEVA